MKILRMLIMIIIVSSVCIAGEKSSMQIKILYADNLPSVKPDGRNWDAIGYADPMVTVYVGGTILASTSFQKDNPNSSITWNESIRMTIDPEKDQLGFKLFDKDLGINDLMGEYFFSQDEMPIKIGHQTFKFFNGIKLTVDIQYVR